MGEMEAALSKPLAFKWCPEACGLLFIPNVQHTVATYRRDLQQLLSHVLGPQVRVAEQHPHVPVPADQGDLGYR